MNYTIRGEKIEVTDAIKEYIETKLSRIDKYFDNPASVNVNVLIKVKNREEKVEVTINTALYQIRSEESHSDLYAAIDLVTDKVERQIRKNKTKLKNRYEKANITEMFFGYEAEEDQDEENLIKKRKDIELKPMDEEEAILQMELSDHDFYVFQNIDTDTICAIYKRKDGYYGIMNTGK